MPSCLSYLKEDDALPPKGLRSGHPTMRLAAAAHARLAQLGSLPYRQYRQQHGLHRAFMAQLEGRTGKRPLRGDGLRLLAGRLVQLEQVKI